MDKLGYDRDIVRRLIFEYASHQPANGQIEVEAVIDPDRDHYQVVHVGCQLPLTVQSILIK